MPDSCHPMDCSPSGSSLHGISIEKLGLGLGLVLGKNTGLCSYFLLQGIFLTQGSNPGLPLCRQYPSLQVDSFLTDLPVYVYIYIYIYIYINNITDT